MDNGNHHTCKRRGASEIDMAAKNFQHIISRLPYTHPFLFVDQLISLDENGASGNFLFPKDAFFYEGHFKNRPVTPGVILTECMAQIGVVCLGIYLLDDLKENIQGEPGIALSSTEMDFYLPVLPGEQVRVVSQKEYFRFSKLKCKVEMFNEEDRLVCRGKIAGMLGQ